MMYFLSRCHSLLASSLLVLIASISWGEETVPPPVDHIAPVLVVKTISPAEIHLGRSATYQLQVKNLGQQAAEIVVVQVALPTDARLLSASPQPGTIEEGVARFNLGKIAPRQQREIRLELKPEKTGPIQLQARTSFATQNETQIQVRQAKLELHCSAPIEIGYGDRVQYQITVSNTGDGTAEDVIVTPTFPSETHIDQSSTDPMTFVQLAPGESQVVHFSVNALTEKALDARFTARGSMDQMAETEWHTLVTRPRLEIVVDGPSIRYLHRNGEYIVRVKNPGDAPAQHIDVEMAIPFGLKILGTSKEGLCSQEENLLCWKIPQLNPSEEVTWSVYTRAVEEGRQVPQAKAKSRDGLSAVDQISTDVVLRPQLFAAVINESGPVEVGEIATFTVAVTNHGTQHANHVVIRVELPDGMEAEEREGLKINGRQLQFDPINLAIDQRRELLFRATGHRQGEHIVRAMYGNDASETELAVEGEAFFYSDNQTYVAERPELDADAPPRRLK
jgi:uncharacterized repeat protein (TIGR01451 family)